MLCPTILPIYSGYRRNLTRPILCLAKMAWVWYSEHGQSSFYLTKFLLGSFVSFFSLLGDSIVSISGF